MNPAQAALLNASQHEFNNLALGGVCFISDLHLSEQMPKTLAQFERFCQTVAPQYDTLVILGDLFEYWLGDDTSGSNEAALRVITALNKLRSQGKNIGFIVGNRDFLIGATYAQKAGFTLLPDPCLLTVQGHATLLSHGDLLCTADKSYQRFRRFAHATWVQKLFLKIPNSWRKALANHLRKQSHHKQKEYNAEHLSRIQDVTADAVELWFNNTSARILIHGHTHRPSTHLTIDTLRIVLPDWECEDEQKTRWGYVSWPSGTNKPELRFYRQV